MKTEKPWDKAWINSQMYAVQMAAALPPRRSITARIVAAVRGLFRC